MNSGWAIALAIGSAFLATISQVMLKKSAGAVYKNKLFEYMNILVISSYGILLLTTFLNMLAMQYLPYKLFPVLNSLSYLFVLVFCVILFREKIGRKRIVGVALIIVGVIIFNIK